MFRIFAAWVLFCVVVFGSSLAKAQTAVLLVATDPTQIRELQMAQVMAADSSFWLRAQLKGRTRLAVITAEAGVEQDAAAEAWLGALDFATRMRVAPPLGPRADCANGGAQLLADSGLPEATALVAAQVLRPSSELELQRALAYVGLIVDRTRLAGFIQQTQPPFRVSLFEATSSGGSTSTLRVAGQGLPGELPRVGVVGLRSVPLTWIGLASGSALPVGTEAADASEFAVTYRAASATTDYAEARWRWAAEHPSLWLSEAQATSALFDWTVFPSQGSIAAAVSRYFQTVLGEGAAACEVRVQAARARASHDPADFECNDALDLAQSLRQLGFVAPRLSRLFGTLAADGATFQVAPGAPKNPLLLATDSDTQGCPTSSALIPVTPGTGLPSRNPPVVSDPQYDDPSYASSPAYRSDGSCNAFVGTSDSCSGSSTSDASSGDSCSGNSTSDASSGDSCSGNSTSDASSGDSCSGNSSSSDATSHDSCSGKSDSSADSSGCGKSEYNGDTCSGSSKSSATASAALQSTALSGSGGAGAPHRPRPVRLSLLTLLAAALALPLRRRGASR